MGNRYRYLGLNCFKSTFRRSLTFLSLALVFSCGIRSKDSIPYFGPHAPHPSPFAQNKLILADSSFTNGTQSKKFRSATGTATDSESITRPGIRIVAVLNNSCAKSFCDENPDSNSLTCYLLGSPDYKETLKKQLYGFPLPKSMSITQLDRWAQEKCVIGISNEWPYKSTSYNDTYYPRQKSYLETIRFESAIVKFTKTPLAPVKVAVIDTGVGKHPDLGEANEIPGVIYREDLRSTAHKTAPGCEERNYTNETPLFPHGTAVAGVIGAKSNNSIGIAGIAPNVQIQSFTVGNCTGAMSTAEIGNALLAALAQQAEVVNLSLGGPTSDIAVLYAITQLLNKKTVIVPAAGNEFKNLAVEPTYPASYAKDYKGVISVAWGTQTGELFQGLPGRGGSNYGPDYVKILAPGTNIATTIFPLTYPGWYDSPGYGYLSGTSLAAPMVSAAAALTIGFMKQNNLSYDEQMIEYLITDLGARKSSSLSTYVRKGAILDLDMLIEKLNFLVSTGTTPSPIVITNPSLTYNYNTQSPQLQFSTSWNLSATHFGARIGLFDGTCGTYTASCLIQNFPLSENQGSMTFTLTRNEALPMVPNLSDPSFPLTIQIAVYYVQIDPVTKKAKLTFGIDAKTSINLRSYDMSNSLSPLMGQVSNIRTDMQFLYIQGWTCLQGSNKAIPTSLVDSLGNKIEAQFVYWYPWMSPHLPPLDRLGGFDEKRAPFLASDISILHAKKDTHLSGLEGNPTLITNCRTLTASHGFEFVIPFKDIKEGNLTGKTFSVQVQNPNNSSKTLKLSDKFNNSTFKIPEINYQPTLTSSVNVNRNQNAITIAGSVCSASPSPVRVEFSFTNWNLRCRLKKISNFPNTTDDCNLGGGEGPPNVFDPAISNRSDVALYQYQVKSASDHNPLRTLLNIPYTPDELAASLRKFPVRWPNASIILNSNANAYAMAFTDFIKANDLREVASGEPITGFQSNTVKITDQGSMPKSLLTEFYADRVNNSILSSDPALARYWDWYDVGEPYTLSVVGYKTDSSKPVGDYLLRNFQVTKVLREVKKYETPLGNQTQNLGHTVIRKPVMTAAPCLFQFSFSHPIPDITTYKPLITAYINALLRSNEAPLDFVPIDEITASMREVPINIRFFQDGVMILHLLSDFHDRTYPIPTLGRGGP